MIKHRVGGFFRDEFGGGTIWGLMWFVVLTGICGLAGRQH